MTIQNVTGHAVRLLLVAFFGGTLSFADSVFSLLPEDGTINVLPLETIGWGYSIQNSTNDYLLPIGLSDTGLLYGSLVDIFDYPVVDPGQTAYQAYSFNAPGGFGNSLGLFEYTAPLNLPLRLDQTGTFTLMYQLYDANPDLNSSAFAIGDIQTASVTFDLRSGSNVAVPEPGVFGMVGFAALAILFRRRLGTA